MTTKRLYIRASNNYKEKGDQQIVPINTNEPVVVESDLGKFELIINIASFDGSKPHLSNSCRSQGDKKYLNGDERGADANLVKRSDKYVSFEVFFTPNEDISGTELLFGNDIDVPVSKWIPTSLLNTGLKLFTWFINKTVKGDASGDHPFIYGMAINSFLYIHECDEGEHPEKKPIDSKENLGEGIPTKPSDRVSYFLKPANCAKFTWQKGKRYQLHFDSDFIKMADSKYAISLPTFAGKSFDINVSNYANETLNNFNWVIKKGGQTKVGEGVPGLIVNFALLDEEDVQDGKKDDEKKSGDNFHLDEVE
ncbi:hypothetical protein DICA3_C13542 [Diutina catenulata]